MAGSSEIKTLSVESAIRSLVRKNLLPDRHFIKRDPLIHYFALCDVRMRQAHDVERSACGLAEVAPAGVRARERPSCGNPQGLLSIAVDEGAVDG